MKADPNTSSNPEFEKFDGVMRKILSVSRAELQKREKNWKRNKTRREKRAKTSPASRASSGKN